MKDAALVFAIMGVVITLVAMLQLNRNLSPFPTPRQGARFVKTGLFKYVRHPIYGGILLGLSAYSIYSVSGFRVLICISLYALFYIKTEYEEKRLEEKFEEYPAYRSGTGRFFPKIN
ncbi:isoprenylcysteine carboxylmethyltransferase family protein [Gramella sp. GC03-9]|uniref:Isoprenylcysteine carboxylmethyltransferase family protein n=1 Tax=Christiangramia oceanisediminis TaxID=2920386 RepID=A0A9X2KZR8_9FLAO|nr:isoprenylcysteine carboxylmethyltransferase family protein [Gramella oceanisediminis]MCP9201358.1 isoprenylcysteine carboxylmethyltransferase family protein [Gramella oceanisediminis]